MAWWAATAVRVSSGSASSSCASGLAKPFDLPARARATAARLVGAQLSWRTPRSSHCFADALDQPSLAAEQTCAGLDLHHDGRRRRERFDDGDAGRELKAPGRESRGRLSAPWLVAGKDVGEQRCPQHELDLARVVATWRVAMMRLGGAAAA